MRQLAGAYIGSFGPWAPKWNQSGCCSDVQLECHSECAYISGCDNTQSRNVVHPSNIPQSKPSTFSFNNTEDYSSLDKINLESRISINDNEINVFPNPVVDELIVDISKADIGFQTNVSITIFNIHGTQIAKSKVNSSDTISKFDMSGNLPGIYIVKIESSKSNQKYFRIIKN